MNEIFWKATEGEMFESFLRMTDEQAQAFFMRWTGNPAGSQRMALQALDNLRERNLVALRADGAYQDLQWRSFGKWVFWEGSSPYQGFALHGSTQVNVGGNLFNYGALGSNQGIVDAHSCSRSADHS